VPEAVEEPVMEEPVLEDDSPDVEIDGGGDNEAADEGPSDSDSSINVVTPEPPPDQNSGSDVYQVIPESPEQDNE
jgi:hypothetical protein